MEIGLMETFVATRAALENLVDAVDVFVSKRSAIEGMGDQSTPEMRHEEWASYMELLRARESANYFTRPAIPAAQQITQADKARCPACGGDGCDLEDSSQACYACGGTGLAA